MILKTARIAATVALCAASAGCIGRMGPSEPRPGAASADGAQDLAYAGLPVVAVEKIEGGSTARRESYERAFREGAARIGVRLGERAEAAYSVRGYLSAYPAMDGTYLSSVWDVYDGAHERVTRLNDEVLVKKNVVDAWQAADAVTMEGMGARAAAQVAAAVARVVAGKAPPAAAAKGAPNPLPAPDGADKGGVSEGSRREAVLAAGL